MGPSLRTGTEAGATLRGPVSHGLVCVVGWGVEAFWGYMTPCGGSSRGTQLGSPCPRCVRWGTQWVGGEGQPGQDGSKEGEREIWLEAAQQPAWGRASTTGHMCVPLRLSPHRQSCEWGNCPITAPLDQGHGCLALHSVSCTGTGEQGANLGNS